MDAKYFVAFDLGATSGRTILGKLESQRLELKEITRFSNQMLQWNGHSYWNLFSLFDNIKKGLSEVLKIGVEITSIGIDTWGVDIACLNGDGEFCGIPYAYRDTQTIGVKEKFFKDEMSSKDTYLLTGIQHMDFNTIFQLYAMKQRNCANLQAAETILFIPDALNYMLTGKKATEFTIASTSGLINSETKTWDESLLDIVGVNKNKWAPLVKPGTVIGNLTVELMEELGIHQTIPVIAVAEHDTASAIAAIPAKNQNFAYLSSGTWSLMGVVNTSAIVNDESASNDITNEGGVEDTVCMLRNITGMWIVEQCLKKWKKDGIDYSYPEMVRLANDSKGFVSFINPDDPSFVNPIDMPEAIRQYCICTNQPVPVTHGEFIRMIFESLAMKYRETFDTFGKLTSKTFEKLHVISGGSRNALLNQFTANVLGVPVVAGPAEASSLGNIMIQAKAAGFVCSLQGIRDIVSNSVEVNEFLPTQTDDWNRAYIKYLSFVR